MHLRAALQRGFRSRTGAGLSVLALMAGLGVGAAPTAQARADNVYCGRHKVVGEIEQRYIAMKGPDGPLGCPLTDELVNPDGFGRRTQFEHGTIYWSPRSGAWPVWGDIGEYWCNEGCERGAMGYPVSYEHKVGDEIQQRFQCAVIHFKQVSATATKLWRDLICD